MRQTCIRRFLPDFDEPVAGYVAFPRGSGGLQPRHVAEPRTEEAPEHPDQAGLFTSYWGAYAVIVDIDDDYIDQGPTLASHRRISHDDPYRLQIF